MFSMYERDNSSFVIDFLSNASYSGYRNHIQKDILQENVKFEQCDWP